MISFGSNTKVYLATGPTDMRKAVNGLMVLVQDVLQADPFSSHLFVFCNRLRDKIKIPDNFLYDRCRLDDLELRAKKQRIEPNKDRKSVV